MCVGVFDQAIICNDPDSKVRGANMGPTWVLSASHGAHLGPVSPRWAPCWPHEPCYQGMIKKTSHGIDLALPKYLDFSVRRVEWCQVMGYSFCVNIVLEHEPGRKPQLHWDRDWKAREEITEISILINALLICLYRGGGGGETTTVNK